MRRLCPVIVPSVSVCPAFRAALACALRKCLLDAELLEDANYALRITRCKLSGRLTWLLLREVASP
jgi:hypothetical protein